LLRILVAEDVAMVRGALAALIELQPDLKVVAEVERGEDILPVALAHRPDVAIIDIDQPGHDGLAAATKLRKQLPTCRTLILTSLGHPGALRRVLAAEVSGFIFKDTPAGQLATAIRGVASGRHVFNTQIAVAAWDCGDSPLSQREHTVLRMAADGSEPVEIAADLHLSVGTVRNYLTTIVAKLHARNRVDAIRKAYDAGWLP
jgi:two-component system response regulator DesR